MSDLDEDYDVTNRVLNDYLIEINADFKLDNDYSTSTSQEPPRQETTSSNEPLSLNPILSQLFFNSSQLNSNLTILTQSDKKFLIEFLLSLRTHLTSLNLNDLKQFFLLNILSFSLLALVGFILGLVFLPLIYLSFLFVLFKFELKMFSLLIEYSNKLVQEYLNKSNKIIHYLKEVHMITLASKIRLQLESKSSLEDNTLDLINYPYRKLCFKHLKKHFYEINYLNKKQLDLIRSNLVDRDQFIASLKQTELSDVLQSTNEIDLNKLTDFFSLNCLKSMLKLNKLTLSEQLKLNELNKISLFVSQPTSLIRLSARSFQFLVYLVWFQSKLIRFNTELNELHSICMLIKQSGQTSCVEKENKSENELERVLLNYVRQALLNCYQLRKSTQLETKKELAQMLKYDFEYCGLYFQKILAKLEPDENKTETNQLVETNEKTNSNEEKLIDKKIENEKPLVEEDIIYEADIVDANEDDECGNTNDEMLLLKETKLANKNLFYELKYALKSKKNEWLEREKKARRVGDVLTNSDDLEEDLFTLKDLTNHLLDNDAFKHKSIIKKKNRLEMESERQNGNRNKYELVEENVTDCTQMTNVLFLNEFMSKRNKLFINLNNEENEQDDEIIYE